MTNARLDAICPRLTQTSARRLRRRFDSPRKVETARTQRLPVVNRPAGGARSERHPREPHDWYCENATPVEQLFDAIDFGDDVIWDPSCGRGNILDVASRRGHRVIGSDLFDRRNVSRRHPWFRADFLRLGADGVPRTGGRRLSIINNPPYSYIGDICEAFIRRALELPVFRAAFVVPIAFLASNERWRFFQREFKPSHIAVLSERPSMPPGSTVTEFTEFKGGMQDYVWVIYTAGNGHRWRTETIWLRPSTI